MKKNSSKEYYRRLREDPEKYEKLLERNRQRYHERSEIQKSKDDERNKLRYKNLVNIWDEDPRIFLFGQAKYRSSKYKEVFDLKLEDIKIPKVCPVFKVPFQRNTPYAYSIDRIDSSKGYFKGNVQVISKLANAMKQNATQEQLKMFADWINEKEDEIMNEKQIEDYISNELEEKSFEEILEEHDLSPSDVFIILFNNGHIDTELLENMMGA
jgi:hypothetical protein